MKKQLVVIVSVILMSISAYAQEQKCPHFEVSAGFGGPGYVLGAVGGGVSYFSVTGEFKYTPIKWVSVGLVAGLHDMRPGDDYTHEHPEAADEAPTYEGNLMLMLYGNWLTREKVKLYSGIGYGTIGGYVDGDGRPSHGIQVTPIGVTFGKKVYGFAELGMGWMFCPARAGIGYRF